MSFLKKGMMIAAIIVFSSNLMAFNCKEEILKGRNVSNVSIIDYVNIVCQVIEKEKVFTKIKDYKEFRSCLNLIGQRGESLLSSLGVCVKKNKELYGKVKVLLPPKEPEPDYD